MLSWLSRSTDCGTRTAGKPRPRRWNGENHSARSRRAGLLRDRDRAANRDGKGKNPRSARSNRPSIRRPVAVAIAVASLSLGRRGGASVAESRPGTPPSLVSTVNNPEALHGRCCCQPTRLLRKASGRIQAHRRQDCTLLHSLKRRPCSCEKPCKAVRFGTEPDSWTRYTRGGCASAPSRDSLGVLGVGSRPCSLTRRRNGPTPIDLAAIQCLFLLRQTTPSDGSPQLRQGC